MISGMDVMKKAWNEEALRRLGEENSDLEQTVKDFRSQRRLLEQKYYDAERDNCMLRSQLKFVSMQLAKASAGWIDVQDFLPSDLGDINQVRLDPDVFLVWVMDASEAAPATFDVDRQKFHPLKQNATFGKPVLFWRYLPEGPDPSRRYLPYSEDEDSNSRLESVMKDLDTDLFMKQKDWLYRQICELEPSGEEATACPEGILHLMDELQDAAEEMGLKFQNK